MSDDQDDLRAQLALEAKLIDWQVYRARETRSVRGVECPAGSYWAVHWRVAEPAVVAASLGELERAVNARATPERSIMRELSTDDESRHLEVSPGHWLLPGPPP